MDLDPALTLAFVLRANPGAYALLLGSGVSRGVVPTGWDVLVDLVGKMAMTAGVTDEDPLRWYERTMGVAVGYDSVLGELTSTPEERVGLLRSYFEPSSDDEAADEKQPTSAHRAIARLMKAGLVRVVLTTNFDRLLERALDEVGVAPSVLSNLSAVKGAVPLHQQRACVIKLHGDYLDPGFRNTMEELAAYPDELDCLLDQIIDEYGLVVAGRSTIWDPALRSAVERCTTRRYGTYWIDPVPLSESAKGLVVRRDATLVTVTADSFFARLADTVETLADIDRPHPASVAVAVASVKRCVERGDVIRLHDLLAEELKQAKAGIGTWPFQGNTDDFKRLVDRIDAATAIVTALVATSVFWGNPTTDKFLDADHDRVGNPASSGGQHCLH